VIDRDAEPRVRDIRLAERLGFERPRKIRELIERNFAELETYGLLPRHRAPIVSGKGGVQWTEEYWLNEAQSSLLCMWSKAVDKRLASLARRRAEI
jgi:hypothetical protein